MSYLHYHDHVDMVTAGWCPPPGDGIPLPANPANRRCPGIVLMLEQHRRRWTDITATLGQPIVSARKGQSLVNEGICYSHLD